MICKESMRLQLERRFSYLLLWKFTIISFAIDEQVSQFGKMALALSVKRVKNKNTQRS